MNIAFKAMLFAKEKHKNQVRKYTGEPYFSHLAEVAGIVSTVSPNFGIYAQDMIATAFLHDCMEDQEVGWGELKAEFGPFVADAVEMLSDLEEGNREARKRLSRQRLDLASHWVQTVKVADLISNTSSIMRYDPKFAKVYLKEIRLLLDVLTRADDLLLGHMNQQWEDARHALAIQTLIEQP